MPSLIAARDAPRGAFRQRRVPERGDNPLAGAAFRVPVRLDQLNQPRLLDPFLSDEHEASIVQKDDGVKHMLKN